MVNDRCSRSGRREPWFTLPLSIRGLTDVARRWAGESAFGEWGQRLGRALPPRRREGRLGEGSPAASIFRAFL
jgi:hypothetical protein